MLSAIVGTEGIGADQLGQPVGLVRLGLPLGPHLVQHDGDAAAGELPGGLRAGEAAADDMDGGGHGRANLVGRAGRFNGAQK